MECTHFREQRITFANNELVPRSTNMFQALFWLHMGTKANLIGHLTVVLGSKKVLLARSVRSPRGYDTRGGSLANILVHVGATATAALLKSFQTVKAFCLTSSEAGWHFLALIYRIAPRRFGAFEVHPTPIFAFRFQNTHCSHRSAPRFLAKLGDTKYWDSWNTFVEPLCLQKVKKKIAV